ncbi:MAG: hypothetical protein LUD02_12600 [Tannerellaceae bacterium]|nr:hypothetical protein [Tannerellaceae bacterium]MCD8264879.1 hypothetical protein [Tannerellaceae bacterium]
MDNIGDWLYIVFLIIAAFSGLFSSFKKKKVADTQPQPIKEEIYPEESGGKGFWDFLEEMQNQQPEGIEIKKPKKKKKISQPASQTKVYGKHTPATSSFLPEITHDTEVVTDDLNLTDPNEIRKAVIYSEIFTRKY